MKTIYICNVPVCEIGVQISKRYKGWFETYLLIGKRKKIVYRDKSMAECDKFIQHYHFHRE